MITDIEKIVREYLAGVLHMSLATSIDDKPWVCEVHFVFDEDLNLYFRSKMSRRHSQEIAKNKNVGGNIVEQHALDDKVRGVYFEGTAEMIEVTENDEIYKLFAKRMNADEKIIEDAQKDDGHKFYKVSVENFYLFDSRNSTPSKKYKLSWSK